MTHAAVQGNQASVLAQSRRIHLVGIGGIGMSGIAELLMTLGHDVSGSDLQTTQITERLERLGAHVTAGHAATNLGDVDLVVVSTAVPPDNPERVAALARGVPVMPRGEMLAELARVKRTVAVVGSHGKTTTTAMVASMLHEAGLDPTAVIGGRLGAFDSNARVGNGPFMVVEADESDKSFLRLDPEAAILTNLDDEHLDAYGGMNELEAAFQQFAGRVAAAGFVVLSREDVRLRHMLRELSGHVLTYGIDDQDASVRATDVVLESNASHGHVEMTHAGGVDTAELTLRVPGRHNVLNALGALAAAVGVGVPMQVAARSLERFHGVDRRFQRYDDVDGVLVIDDYAHHPTEIAAVLRTARLFAPKRLRVIFQPHRYSRTARLLDQFADTLAKVDDVIVTDVYAASEQPLAGATAEALVRAILKVSNGRVRHMAALDDIPQRVAEDAVSGDMIITLGAGSIGTIAPRVVEALLQRRQWRARR